LSIGNGSVSRDQIVRAAEKLFNLNGYRATSMRQIADAVGLKAGSLYSHIGSKEEVLRQILDDVAKEILDSAYAARDLNGTPREQLYSFVRGYLKAVGQRPAIARILLFDWRSMPPARQRAIRGMRDTFEKILDAIIAEGQRTGDFRKLDPKWVRLVLLSALNWAGQWFDPKGSNTPHEIADELLNVMLQGIAVSRASGDRGRR
jgi:AcrR family transcriptional regulator